MPTSLEVVLPRTKDANEFEDMVCDVCRKKYKKEFQRYGRTGQKQDGIDIISVGVKKIICVQCKNYKISKKDIKDIIREVKGCKLPISKFIIATSTSRDTELQNFITEINNSCTGDLNFKIYIMFWEEIANNIILHKKMMKKYFSVINREKPVDNLVSKFNESIKRNEIFYFLNENPIIGIPKNDFSSVELFVNEIKYLLEEDGALKDNSRFIAIREFATVINNYYNFLCTKLYLVDDMYKSQNYLWDGEINCADLLISNSVIRFKYELERLYGIINNVHSQIFSRFNL
ncbi:MAG: hypothetical protein HDQ99_02755 [Lachnospiraceae bacterium]|nr:hypothetical protein [Lachnospiraceae bacterium]